MHIVAKALACYDKPCPGCPSVMWQLYVLLHTSLYSSIYIIIIQSYTYMDM